jgi:4-amino-4-deoxy-L-arabinose transferase-like glycosyltransferase
MGRIRRSWVLAIILALFVALSILYNVYTPIFESPDELQHTAFVAWLDDHGALPVVTKDKPGPWEQEGTQPPLYYWLAAALVGWQPHDAADSLADVNPHAGGIGDPKRPDNKNRVIHDPAGESWPYHGTVLFVHLLRLVSTLIGVGTLLAIYRLGRTVFPDRPGIALGMIGLVAFIPQFLFLSASVNNDNLVILICSWTVVLLASWLYATKLPSWLGLGVLGLLLGLAALSKLSGLFLWPLAAATLAWLAWRQRRLAWLVPAGLLVLGLALGLSGWWFARNLHLYGDLSGINAHLWVMGPRQEWPTTLGAIYSEFRGFRYSFWALFGWFSVLVPDPIYWIIDLLTIAGCAGFALYLYRSIPMPSLRSGHRAGRHNKALPVILLLFLWFVLVAIGLVRWTLLTPASQGRLLFPALVSIAFVLVVGWAELVPNRWRWPAATAFLAAWAAWAALCPILIIAPTYAEPQRYHSLAELNAVPSIINVRYDDFCDLIGYIQPDGPIQAGDRVPLTLIWRARQPTSVDYSIFVHASAPDGTIEGQIDTYPGGGRYPTSRWQPGEIISDTVYIPMSEDAQGPALIRFSVGLYDHKTRAELPAFGTDGKELRYVFAGEAALEPPAWPAPQPELLTDTLFGQEVRLIGADLSQETIRPGEVVTVTLHWQGMANIRDDYIGFVHLIAPAGESVAQDDHSPLRGRYPTRIWSRGTVLADPYRLELPAGLAPGVYDLWGGLYHPESGVRLQAISWQTGQRWQDDLVHIGTLAVE